jgi:MFS family permease
MTGQSVGTSMTLGGQPEFRRLAASTLISVIGDQFSVVAIPWLALTLTGDPAQLAFVLAAGGAPRIVLMLLGGALSDRWSSRQVLVVTRLLNAAVLLALAGLLFAGSVALWHLYVAAALLGLVSAFSSPANAAIVPSVIAAHHLSKANAILMAVRQAALLAGLLLAGMVIAAADGGGRPGGAVFGLAVALAVDAATFLISAALICRLRAVVSPPSTQEGLLASISSGLSGFIADRSLPALAVFYAGATLAISGPIQVALPVLARQAFGGDARAFALLQAANALGALAGMLLRSLRTPPWMRKLGVVLAVGHLAIAGLLYAVAEASSLGQAAGLLFIAGLIGAFVQLSVMTFIQRRTPSAAMGRVMSVFSVIFMGLPPMSAALTGGLLAVGSADQMLLLAALGLAVISLLALLNRTFRDLERPAPGAEAAQTGLTSKMGK